MKKIFHIIPTLRSGGAEKQLAELVRGTSRDGFSHRVCALGESDFFGPEIEKAGAEVIDLGLIGKRPWFKAAGKISALIKNDRPDIIHSWLYDANITARLVKLRFRNIPLITSLQAPDYEPDVIRSTGWPVHKVAVRRLIDKLSVKLTDPYFVACSEFVAGSYRRNLGVSPARMSVIHNSVSLDTLASAPGAAEKVRESLGIAGDEFVFLHIGRLDPQKNQAALLRAFRQVLERAPKAHLVMIGNGRLEASLKSLSGELNTDGRVHFLGVRSDVGACLEMADAYVFPSLSEGLPLALLEAMAKGLPCIASNIEPHREIIDDEISGLLVEPGSDAKLAAAMIRIYNDADLRGKLAKASFNKAREQFYSGVLLPLWEKLYEETS